MSYRLHVTHPNSIVVQFGTKQTCSDNIGLELDEYDDPEELLLVLNDVGNGEALVLAGSEEDWQNLVDRIQAGINAGKVVS